MDDKLLPQTTIPKGKRPVFSGYTVLETQLLPEVSGFGSRAYLRSDLQFSPSSFQLNSQECPCINSNKPLLTHGCGSKLNRRGKPQVLVHVSTYQVNPFWYRLFEPQPHVSLAVCRVVSKRVHQLLVSWLRLARWEVRWGRRRTSWSSSPPPRKGLHGRGLRPSPVVSFGTALLPRSERSPNHHSLKVKAPFPKFLRRALPGSWLLWILTH